MIFKRSIIATIIALAVMLCSATGCAPGQQQESAPSTQPEQSQPYGPQLTILPDKVGGIDFAKWHKRNDDMVGWLKIKGTNIDNVVMQYSDNDYYLHRGVDKQAYDPGTVFMDFRNNRWLSDYNTVFYGHHMADGSMFRDIARYIDPTYLKAHSKITYINHAGIKKLTPFFCWAEHVNDDMNRTEFDNLDQFRAYWKKRLKGKKLYNNVDLDEIDHIYTFYTCSYQGYDYRTVLLAASL